MRSFIRVLYSFFLLMMLPTAVKAQPEALVSYENEGETNGSRSYHSGEPVFIPGTDSSGKFFHFALPGHHYSSDPGKPQMPVKVQIVEVPKGKIVTVKISEVKTKHIDFKNHNLKGKYLYPAQIEGTKNELQDEKVKLFDNKIYSQKSIIGHDTVTVKLIGCHRGIDIFEIAIYPLFYNPVGESVDLITSMELDVSMSDVKGVAGISISEAEGSVLNKAYINGYVEDPVGLIILTDTLFKKALEPFIKWKTISGYEVTMLYMGEGLAGTTYNEIKATLSGQYNALLTLNKAPRYLLIAGDISIIPSSGETTNISDLYYSEFDGNNDYIPELYCGRLPVSDTTQLKTVLKKIIDYEKFSYDQSNRFWERALLTAGNDAGYSPVMNGQVNYLSDYYFNSANDLKSISWQYPASITKDDSLRLLLNNGLGIVNYTGHGDAAGFADPSFKVTNIASIANKDMYPVVIANACRTAQLSAAKCFGREMLITEDKGAVAYIGCTNDSYWSEDFYWSVGTGTPDITATYENTGLGAFDRLFHSHNEDPADWHYTLGQINYAGNLSVSASSSTKKKYYWETYMLLGDPTMIPITGKPDTLSVSLPDTIPNTLSGITFLTVPFAYAAISDFDTLWDASFSGPSGNVSLEIPSGIKDSCLIVITGQNIVPYTKTIYFGDNSDELLSYSDLVIDDSDGNNNGRCDYGERVSLSIKLKNLGSRTARDIRTSLSVTNGTITVERDTIRIAELAGGASITITDSLVLSISDTSKDQEIALMLLSIRDKKREYVLGMDITLFAPVPVIISCIADDSATGNGNGVPDPGEEMVLFVKVKNGGSSDARGYVTIAGHVSLLEIAKSNFDAGVIGPENEASVLIPVTISHEAESGAVIPFSVGLEFDNYSVSSSYTLRAGKTRETWEQNSFSVLPWITFDHFPWVITSSSSFENILSARSASIDHLTESILAIYLNNPETDTLSFNARVSSEDPFDLLIFRCDSIELMKASGETGWFKKSFILTQGLHYLEWVYKKDISRTNGLDAAWIDMIDFPDHSFILTDIKADTVFIPAPSTDHSKDIITGRIINLGRDTVEMVPLYYRINDGYAVRENFEVKLPPGDTALVNFAERCNFSIPDKYNIFFFSALPEDGYNSNDTTKSFYNKVDFDNPDTYKTKVNVYPNPFYKNVYYDYFTPETGYATIEISDISGCLVYKKTELFYAGDNKKKELGIDGLAAGVYIMQIRQNTHLVQTKIVKTNLIKN